MRHGFMGEPCLSLAFALSLVSWFPSPPSSLDWRLFGEGPKRLATACACQQGLVFTMSISSTVRLVCPSYAPIPLVGQSENDRLPELFYKPLF